MNIRKKIWVPVLLVVIGIVVGLGSSSHLNLNTKAYSDDGKISKEAIEMLSKTNQAVAEVVDAVKPSVVNISSTRTIKEGKSFSPFSRDPFFKRFFGDEFKFFDNSRQRKQAGLGSGVIVDSKGYILTNNHVIQDADEIKVKLADKREFTGKVIGVDRKTDLAVIQIEANDLTSIRFGDSDKLKVGEAVLAIGNPFGLSHTVTSGIVSATGRANVGVADYEDFIQTDAPINPGNSGGALVNIMGELIGVNTAIFSTTGGYQGIGFAIPSNMARTVMESLIKDGKVVRGWFGVSIQSLNPDLAKQFNINDERGVLIADVMQDSPAEKAGIKRGDVIREFDGKEVNDITVLRNMVANTLPNTKVAVIILRDGKLRTVEVTIAEMPSEVQSLSMTTDNNLRGVHVQDLTPQLKKNLDIPNRINGVLITDIEEGSPADGTLLRGDIIMEINKHQIENTKEYETVISTISSHDNILILIFRKKSVLYVTL